MVNQNDGSIGNDDGLTRIVLKLAKDDSEFRVEGLNNIHPMYEAIIALARQQYKGLSDQELGKFFANNDADDDLLRKSLILDGMVSYLDVHKGNSYSSGLKRMVDGKKSFVEILETGALQISETKRLQDGKVLGPLGSSNDKYLIKALKTINPSDIYVKPAEIAGLKEKAHRMHRNRVRGVFLAIGLAAAIGLTSYYLGRRSVYRSADRAIEQMMKDGGSRLNTGSAYEPASDSAYYGSTP